MPRRSARFRVKATQLSFGLLEFGHALDRCGYDLTISSSLELSEALPVMCPASGETRCVVAAVLAHERVVGGMTANLQSAAIAAEVSA